MHGTGPLRVGGNIQCIPDANTVMDSTERLKDGETSILDEVSLTSHEEEIIL